MSEVIKQWVYYDYSQNPKNIEYRSDGIWVESSYPGGNIIKTVADYLTYPYLLGDYQTDSQIAQYLALHHSFEGNSISEELSNILKFWRNIDLNKLPELTFYPTKKYNHRTFLELSPKGTRNGYLDYNDDTKKYDHNGLQRMHDLFFKGPNLSKLSMEDRLKLRQILLAAMDTKAGFKQSDSFPLFDYNKIPKKKWEYSSDNMFSGDYVELNQDHFTIGGWSNPRDGGARDESIEFIWSKRPHFVDKMFDKANEELDVILSNALIKEN